MNKYLAMVTLLTIAGCASMALEDELKTKTAAINAKWDARVVYTCDPSKPELNCADVILKFSKDEDEVRKAVCQNLKRAECELKLNEVIVARFKLKYRLVDLKDIKPLCDAHPETCNSRVKMETIFATAENEIIKRLRKLELDELKNNIHERKVAVEQTSGWGAALSEFGKGLQQNKPQVCETRPTGFGGAYRTECQ